MVNIDIECVDYRKKETVPDDESENNDMKDKHECIETIFEDAMLWQQSMVERMFEEEDVVGKIKLCFNTNSRKFKEKLQQQQVKEHGAYKNKAQQRIKQF